MPLPQPPPLTAPSPDSPPVSPAPQPRLFVASFTLVLPFFPTGTAERVEVEGDVATAVSLSRLLDAVPLSRGGPSSVVIFDIHALQERFYFGDTVLPLFESGIPILRERLEQLRAEAASKGDPSLADVAVAYPDEGAWKRFHTQFGDYPEIICTKVRDGQRRIVRLKEGEPRGRHVVIVDDLIQSGGTLIECAKMLRSMGASHISSYATHGVFPGESWRRFRPEAEASDDVVGFHRVWLTDSVAPTATAVLDVEPFEVLSLADVIAETLQI